MTKNKQEILVTGGAGFIGSSFVNLATEHGYKVIVIDKLTYSGNKENLAWIKDFDLENDFYQADIGDKEILAEIFSKYQISKIINFAAESHVDNSINDPSPFIQSNILGTFELLQASRRYFEKLSSEQKSEFRFLHISTDEVFGELEETGKFREDSNYQPNSPYSASKAASDHLVRAWHQTYKLPILITNCSNNYGPRQHQEKLIPTIIANAINGKDIPIYGDGKNVRDWIFVDDHNLAVLNVLENATIGQTYCLGVNNEKNNNQIVHLICERLDKLKPLADSRKYSEQIKYVEDRKGHDKRYAIDSSKIEQELDFKPKYNFEQAIDLTIKWYLNFFEGKK